LLLLDTKVLITLWGNVPEFSTSPPVLESALMLNAPSPGFDADFTLERGRVHVANEKPNGPARVRVRFHREAWDLELTNPQSQVVMDFWGFCPRDVGFSEEPSRQGPVLMLDLYVQGQATLRIGERTIALPNLAKVSWSNIRQEVTKPEVLPKPPEWWTNRIAPQDDKPQLANVMMALGDYNTFLEKREAVVDAVSTAVHESPDATTRALGVLFLGALDALPQLIDSLEDRQHAEVRGSAAYGLRHWMSRNREQDAQLYRTLIESKLYPKEKANTIMRLLHYVSEADAQRPGTYQTLIADLNHENLSIRDLAFWHLAHLVPEGASTIPYDPAGDAEKRQQAVQEWKKLMAAGKIPPRPRSKAG
jgi:hypothetical protein